MDLKKLKKESSVINQPDKKAKSEKKTESKKSVVSGVKSNLKIDSYNNKYKGENDVFQDNAGIKKLNARKWKLASEESNDESIDNPADSKVNFYDENGNEVAMQG